MVVFRVDVTFVHKNDLNFFNFTYTAITIVIVRKGHHGTPWRGIVYHYNTSSQSHIIIIHNVNSYYIGS